MRSRYGTRRLPLAGSVRYLGGTIALTLIRHVPLNDALAGLDPSSAAAVDTCARYVSGWTGWNHVRAAAALAAAVAFTGARGG